MEKKVKTMSGSKRITTLEKRVAALEKQLQEQPKEFTYSTSVHVSKGCANNLVIENCKKREIVGCV